MLKTLFVIAVIGLSVSAFAMIVVATLFGYAKAIGALSDGEPAEALPGAAALERAPAAVGPVAAGVAGADRDPVIGTDIATADRHARIAAFQRRETTERAARGFTSRGY